MSDSGREDGRGAAAALRPAGRRAGNEGWQWAQKPLRVSAAGRSLEDLDGRPCFYLADRAWMCLWKGAPEQWERYFDLRVAQGYSVIQTDLLPFEWGKSDAAGNLPFVNQDLSRPNDAYFARAERFCRMAAERGLYVCLFLFWTGPRNTGPSSHFSTEQAQAFARYAVERFGRYPVLWSLSGDGGYHREPEKWEAIGRAVEEADGWAHPTTIHLWTRIDWHFLFHPSRWLDFHMVQTGHSRWAYADVADVPAAYRALEPAKPMVNGEPWYENYPERRGPGIGPPWHVAMGYEGAAHCGVGATVLRGLPWWRLRPAPERVHLDPAAETNFRPFCAVVPHELWVVYVPRGPLAPGQLVLKGLDASDGWRARWIDPRTGQSQDARTAPAPASSWWPRSEACWGCARRAHRTSMASRRGAAPHRRACDAAHGQATGGDAGRHRRRSTCACRSAVGRASAAALGPLQCTHGAVRRAPARHQRGRQQPHQDARAEALL